MIKTGSTPAYVDWDVYPRAGFASDIASYGNRFAYCVTDTDTKVVSNNYQDQYGVYFTDANSNNSLATWNHSTIGNSQYEVTNFFKAHNNRVFMKVYPHNDASITLGTLFLTDDNFSTVTNIVNTHNNPYTSSVDTITRICKLGSNRLFGVGSYSVWHSNDNGNTWTCESKDRSAYFDYNGLTSVNGRLIRTGQCYINDVSTYVVQYSDDEGETWTTVTPDVGTSNMYIGEVEFNDIINQVVLIIKYGGTSKIYESLDRGSTWSLAKNLGNMDVKSINIDHINSLMWFNDNGFPVHKATVSAVRAKYLDQNGADELVAQFRDYVDGLVGA